MFVNDFKYIFTDHTVADKTFGDPMVLWKFMDVVIPTIIKLIYHTCHKICIPFITVHGIVQSDIDSSGLFHCPTGLGGGSGSGAHFTNNFSITIQMWWKFHFALIQILIKWSLQYLAHGTTAGLSWHVPNFVAMWSSVIELELNEISITFELWWKNH